MTTKSSQCATGVPGLDDVLLRRPAARPPLPRRRQSRASARRRSRCSSCSRASRQGERCLYVTLSETKAELDAVARVARLDARRHRRSSSSRRSSSALTAKSQNTLFQPAEVELNNLSKLLLERIEQLKPARLVLDSLSEMRLLAQNPLRYRRQILTFKQRFARAALHRAAARRPQRDRAPTCRCRASCTAWSRCTWCRSSSASTGATLSVTEAARRRASRKATTTTSIKRGGIIALSAARRGRVSRDLRDGRSPRAATRELDLLLGGGLHAGTSNLLMGPAGSGKSTVASLFAHAAAARGEKVMLLRVRRERAHAAQARAGDGARLRGAHRSRACSRCSRSIPPRSRPASSPTRSSSASRSTARA